MAERTGLSKSTIGRIWRRFDLKPHLQGAFKLSSDPQFMNKVVDVVQALPQLARASGGVVRGRKESDSSAGPVPAGVAGHTRMVYSMTTCGTA